MRPNIAPAALTDAFQLTEATAGGIRSFCAFFFKLAINPSLISGAFGLNPEVLREEEDRVYRQKVLF